MIPALVWLLAGVLVCWLFSITAGPGAWWIMLVVAPYALFYLLTERDLND